MSAAEPDLLAYREGALAFDGVPVADLLARFGTPFFALSERAVTEAYRALLDGLLAAGAGATLRYCAKTNNEAGLLALLAAQGSELLASHRAEVELALLCGFAPARIAYQRPVAPAEELEAVLAAGVTHLHLFRPEDLDRFARAARRTGRPLRLSLRLRDGRASASPLGALNRRLGLTADEAWEVALACKGDPGLRVAGLNAYVGTQQTSARAFERSLRAACGLARRLADERLAEIEEINVGGGIPATTVRRLGPRTLWQRWRDAPPALGASPAARLAAYGRALGRRYRAIADAAGLERTPALVAEPGRALVGDAGVLVARVAAVEGRWLFLDTSRNVLGESPLLFCRGLLPVRATAGARRFTHLSGNTLNTTDVLDVWRRLPRLAAGDGLVFCGAGAYSIARASRYAGLPPPVLLLARDGAVRTIRRAETVADLAGPMEPALADAAVRGS